MATQHLEPKEQKKARRTAHAARQRAPGQSPLGARAGYTGVQATLSGDTPLPHAHQQALLSSVGRVGGNRRVQRLVASMNRGQPPVVQRDPEDDIPSDPAQLVNLLGMRCEEGSFGQWFAGHWRRVLGLNPRRVYAGGMGAWIQGAGQTEYTFRPNQRQQSFPSDWYQEMRRLYRTGARVTTSQIAFFWWNRNSLQETVNYWAPLFEPSRRSTAGELATTAMRSEEFRRFLSVMRLSPPDITVPAHMRNAREYSPR